MACCWKRGRKPADGGGQAQTFGELSAFWSKASARAAVFTDAKFDDAVHLWYFFLHNLSRPAGHSVELRVVAVGVQDLDSAAALVQHVWSAAQQYFKVKTGGEPGAAVTVSVFKSRRPVSKAPRHELDTYEPYRSGREGFPQAAAQPVPEYDDADMAAFKADLVTVIAQFLFFEAQHESAAFTLREEALRCLVPGPGGVLVFQFGFNTKMSGSQDEQQGAWETLLGLVEAQRARIVLISNSFSFKAGPKPGALKLKDSPIRLELERQSPALWQHLFSAALQESALFNAAQMAKWLCAFEPGASFGEAPAEYRAKLAEIAASLGYAELPSAQDAVTAELKEKNRAFHEGAAGGGGENEVLKGCQALQALVEATYGATAADYLGRACSGFEKFGESIECTDGQHLLTVMQSVQAVLRPAKLVKHGPNGFGMRPSFLDTAPAAAAVRLFAAKEVDVEQTFTWMVEALDVPLAYQKLLAPGA